MVFESILADVLNRFLGDYVENLDRSQLQVGIWGGDVVLNNLKLKENALDSFNLPIRLTFGNLGKLVLKIPWKSLYVSPVEVTIEDLYAILIPVSNIEYNEAKEKLEQKEFKKKILERIEQSKQLLKEKEKLSKDQGFLEKLIFQIVKNIQVSINRIHIRYEGDIQNEKYAFSAGITLNSLNIYTTDKDWNRTFLQDPERLFYKTLILDCFALYWKREIHYSSSKVLHLELKKNIADSHNNPYQDFYVIHPISVDLKLKVNPSPELYNFEIPKIFFYCSLKEIFICINKQQYNDLVYLLDMLTFVKLGLPYRKYRPSVKFYRNYYDQWWNFAFTCVLEDIRRRKKEFSWTHIKNHRMNCKLYKEAYFKKLTQRRLSEDINSLLNSLEEELDVFNISILRTQAEIEAEKLLGSQTIKEDSKENWLWSWFTGKSQEKDSDQQEGGLQEIKKKLGEAMTIEEKEKLYSAIGFEKDQSALNYPKNFVENKIEFELKSFIFILCIQNENILKCNLIGSILNLEQRPSSDGLLFQAEIQTFDVNGVDNHPLLHSVESTNQKLLYFKFEMNPLDKNCDQHLSMHSQPLEIYYHQQTVEHLFQIFETKSHISVQELQMKAQTTLYGLQQRSMGGLKHLIGKRKILDLDIKLMPSYVIIKDLRNNSLIMCLGTLLIKSHPASDVTKYDEFAKNEFPDKTLFEMLKASSYDIFNIELSGVQVALLLPGESNIQQPMYIFQELTTMHLLPKSDLSFIVKKCIIQDDSRFPLFIITVQLNFIKLQMSKRRLVSLNHLISYLLKSWPSQKYAEAPVQLIKLGTRSNNVEETISKMKIGENINQTVHDIQSVENFIQLQLEILLQGVSCILNNENNKIIEPSLEAGFSNLTLTMKKGQFNLEICAILEEIFLKYYNQNIDLIYTPQISNEKQLLKIVYKSISPDSSQFKNIMQTLNVEFSQLNLCAHLESLESILKLVSDIRKELEKVSYIEHQLLPPKLQKTLSESSLGIPAKVNLDSQATFFLVSVNLDYISFEMSTNSFKISIMEINKLKLSFISKAKKQQLQLKLQNISIRDLNSNTVYSQILTILDKELIHLDLILFTRIPDSEDNISLDASFQISFGQIRFVFLYSYISRILDFSNKIINKATMLEASHKIVETWENVGQTYSQRDYRCQMNVDLKSPMVLFPQNSLSSSLIIFDFGYLTLANHFEKISKHLPTSQLLEYLQVHMADMKISRAIAETNLQAFFSEHIIIKPITFDVKVTRNHSLKSISQEYINISFELPSLQIMISSDDYSTFISCLQENFGEANNSINNTQNLTFTELQTKDIKKTTDINVMKTSSSEIYKTILFSFVLQSASISLYNDDKKMKGLAMMIMNNLSVGGELYSNDFILIKFIVENLEINDERPAANSKGIKKILSKKANNSDSEHNVIYAEFQQTEDISIESTICSLNLVASLDFILQFGSFFTTENKSTSKTMPIKSSKSSYVESNVVKPSKIVNFKLNMQQPDIALIEKMDDINSNAVILNFELSMEGKAEKNCIISNAHISNFQLYSCCFNENRRVETLSQILSPTEMQFNLLLNEKVQNIVIETEELSFHVTPTIIYVLLNIGETLQLSTSSDTNIKPKEKLFWPDLWKPQLIDTCSYNFLKSGEDVVLTLTQSLVRKYLPTREECKIILKQINFIIELGNSNQTVPVLLLESVLLLGIKNWKSQLIVDGQINLEIAYYNMALSSWESILEPVPGTIIGNVMHRPWTLQFECIQHKEVDNSENETHKCDSSVNLKQRSKLLLCLTSEDHLEFTLSKTGMKILTDLSEAFGKPVELMAMKRKGHTGSFIISNELGQEITLIISSKKNSSQEQRHQLSHGQSIELNFKDSKNIIGSVLRRQELSNELEYNMTIKLNHYDSPIDCRLHFADCRFYPLTEKTDASEGLIVDIKAESDYKLVVLRSCVQVKNHLACELHLYSKTVPNGVLQSIGHVNSNHHFNIPLHILRNFISEIYFSIQDYHPTMNGFSWKSVLHYPKMKKVFKCYGGEQNAAMIRVHGEIEQILYAQTSHHSVRSTTYTIHVSPLVVLKNLLPFPLFWSYKSSEHLILQGESLEILDADCNEHNTYLNFKLLDYQGHNWNSLQSMSEPKSSADLHCCIFKNANEKLTLDLGMQSSWENQIWVIKIFSPYWMINKTGLTLSYQASLSTASQFLKVLIHHLCHCFLNEKSVPQDNNPEDVLFHHPPDLPSVLFFFKGKNFMSTNKLQICVGKSNWSEGFSIDGVGSAGSIECRQNDHIYKIGVEIKLASSGLTRIIVFQPYFLLVNNCPFGIEISENKSEWLLINSDDCKALWPLKSSELFLRIYNTSCISPPFSFDCSLSVLLRIDCEYGAVGLEIQVLDSRTVLIFNKFLYGMMTSQLVNDTSNITFFVWQDGINDASLVVPPKYMINYAWQIPSGSKQLVIKGENKTFFCSIEADSVGIIMLENCKIHWISFLNGVQRVLLLTENETLIKSLQSGLYLEMLDIEITVQLSHVGFSLVDNFHPNEILYACVANSGIIWENAKSLDSPFHNVTPKETLLLEKGYQLYLTSSPDADETSKLGDNGQYEVNYKTMNMICPHKRVLRRIFQYGIWINLKVGEQGRHFHGKINHLQLDCQLSNNIFTNVLAPFPLPKTIAYKSKVSLVVQKSENETFYQFKYAKILIQEFLIQLDQVFLNAVIEFFSAEKDMHFSNAEMNADMKILNENLASYIALDLLQQQRHYFCYLHLSPLKLHLSFSLSGVGEDKGQPTGVHSFVFNAVLQTLGVTLTTLQDVIFRLTYFEIENKWMNHHLLTDEIRSHYVTQIMHQLYKIVLGLDVLGNPLGLMTGFAEGARDLFYEPYQGAIQGPEEFIEGVTLGLTSMFSKSVGGTFGAVAKMTETIGRGIGVLTFDKEYQKQRRMRQKPHNVPEGLARGLTGVGQGVYAGVTGVFMKPFVGARDEGVEGFFKGMGQGVIGLVTRPVSGIVDMTTGTLESVREMAQTGKKVHQLRPPRYFYPDKILRPYDQHKAEGQKLFMEIDKGHFMSTDLYICHAVADQGVLMITNHRILFVYKQELLDRWVISWQHLLSELSGPPWLSELGLEIPVRRKRPWFSNIFKHHRDGRTVIFTKNYEQIGKVSTLNVN